MYSFHNKGSRLKLDDDTCNHRFRDILFLFNSVSAKDSFLYHHQELLSKRLLESLHEPRTDLEEMLLKMLGEEVGNIMVSHHSAMLKDIYSSL